MAANGWIRSTADKFINHYLYGKKHGRIALLIVVFGASLSMPGLFQILFLIPCINAQEAPSWPLALRQCDPTFTWMTDSVPLIGVTLLCFILGIVVLWMGHNATRRSRGGCSIDIPECGMFFTQAVGAIAQDNNLVERYVGFGEELPDLVIAGDKGQPGWQPTPMEMVNILATKLRVFPYESIETTQEGKTLLVTAKVKDKQNG